MSAAAAALRRRVEDRSPLRQLVPGVGGRKLPAKHRGPAALCRPAAGSLQRGRRLRKGLGHRCRPPHHCRRPASRSRSATPNRRATGASKPVPTLASRGLSGELFGQARRIGSLTPLGKIGRMRLPCHGCLPAVAGAVDAVGGGQHQVLRHGALAYSHLARRSHGAGGARRVYHRTQVSNGTPEMATFLSERLARLRVIERPQSRKH